MPPIYQPEIATDAIVWVADHDRREVLVGLPTVEAVFGERIAPGLLDRWLAKDGYDAQQTEEPGDPYRPNNLWLPVTGDHGAHGAFDERAKSFRAQHWANIHRDWLAAGAVAAVLGAIALFSGKAIGG